MLSYFFESCRVDIVILIYEWVQDVRGLRWSVFAG
jgi:hypothetical protein